MREKIIYALLLVCTAFIVSSCDDSGLTVEKKKIELTATGLKHLDQNTDGVYEAWLSIGSSHLDHGDDAYVSVGRFNISPAGEIVDTAGNPGKLNLSRVTDINASEDALITIEQPGDNDTIPGTKLLGAAKTTSGGFLIFNLTMDYGEVLPVSGQFAGVDSAKYLLASPTDLYASYNAIHGIWFSKDTLGNTQGLLLPTLPDTAEWVYQAWVVDNRDSLNKIYNVGRFTRSNAPDDNQQCSGPNPGWNLPGHDWIQLNCPGNVADIDDLNNSNYKLIVTLEPKFEQNLAKPFFIRLFYGNVLVTGVYGTPSSIANVTALPTAQIRLSLTQ